MRRRFWGILVLVVLLASACAPVPQLRNEAYYHDTSLISGEPCFAPCWQNITPGVTTWDEANDILSNLSDVTNLDRVRGRDTDEEVYNFHYQDGLQCCRIFSRDGETVASILVLVAPGMTVADVAEHYGEPQYLQANDVTDDQTFITLVFPDVPMLVYAFGAGTTNGTLSAVSEVLGSVYLAPSEMGTFLNETALFVWNGYGALSDLLAGEAQIQAPSTDTGSDESD